MAKNKPSWDLNDLLNTVNEANVNEADQHGFAPIHYVAGSGGLELIKGLIGLGADLNIYTTIDTPKNRAVTPMAVSIKMVKLERCTFYLRREQTQNCQLMDWLH